MPHKPKSHSERQKESSPYKEFYQKYDREKDMHRGSSSERGYDGKWRQARKHFLSSNPLCSDCQKSGRIVPASEVHHMLKVKDNPELFYDSSQWLALCHSCHSKRTARGQ